MNASGLTPSNDTTRHPNQSYDVFWRGQRGSRYETAGILEKFKSHEMDVGFGAARRAWLLRKVACARELHARETLTLAMCNRADTTEILISYTRVRVRAMSSFDIYSTVYIVEVHLTRYICS